MTPDRRAKLETGISLIQQVTRCDQWDTRAATTRDALIRIGAAFTFGNTNQIRLGDVTASCTFDHGEHLLTRWAANARRAIVEDAPDHPETDEEE